MTKQIDHIGDTNKMVTAVEWLRDEWIKRDIDTSIKELFEKAKAMEKEQIVDAATWGTLAETGERYYNEKYGK